LAKPIELTLKDARRLFLLKQGMAGDPPEPTPEGLLKLIRQMGCVQVDAVRRVDHSQHLVLWSRMPGYQREWLDHLLWQERSLFEYWAHAASIVLAENYPIHHYQMRTYNQPRSAWGRRFQAWVAENDAFRRYLLEALEAGGVVDQKDLEDRSETQWGSGGWTSSRQVPMMMTYLWRKGQAVIAGRNGQRKLWALTEQIFPEWGKIELLADEEVARQAIRIALGALGAAPATHIKEHYIRNYYPGLEERLAELVETGEILEASISDGSERQEVPWYLLALDEPLLSDLRRDNWKARTTMLSPFDNLICNRRRTLQLWDFEYKMEIYVPKAKRVYGYYVMPILHGDELVGRLDPQFDRQANTLIVHAFYTEPGVDQIKIAAAVRPELERLRDYLGAESIEVGEGVESAVCNKLV
jgi:uncharacterized protein YcaQ